MSALHKHNQRILSNFYVIFTGKLDVRKIFKIEFEKFDAIYKEIILQVKVYASAIKGDISYVEETAPDMIDAIPVLDYYFLNKRKDPGRFAGAISSISYPISSFNFELFLPT